MGKTLNQVEKYSFALIGNAAGESLSVVALRRKKEGIGKRKGVDKSTIDMN